MNGPRTRLENKRMPGKGEGRDLPPELNKNRNAGRTKKKEGEAEEFGEMGHRSDY
jgi:hypothetical protein